LHYLNILVITTVIPSVTCNCNHTRVYLQQLWNLWDRDMFK